MTKKVLIVIATGSETVEIVAPVDTLRRCEGVEVTIASINGKDPVKTSADIYLTPDVALTEVDKDAYDAIIIPGGLEGHQNLKKCELLGEILKNQYNKGKLVASICMSANVFLAFGIGLGNKITSYPYQTEALKENYEYLEQDVVQDKVSRVRSVGTIKTEFCFFQNMITSRGPGTVYAYSFKLIEYLVGIEKAKAAAQLNLFPNFYWTNER